MKNGELEFFARRGGAELRNGTARALRTQSDEEERVKSKRVPWKN